MYELDQEVGSFIQEQKPTVDFSGLVHRQDLLDPQRQRVFDDMLRFSELWLPLGKRYRPNVPWPLDAIHQWSRQWEYPFAFHHVRQNVILGDRVLDAGSGITFFPFYLALHSFRVDAVDGDRSLVSAYHEINQHLPEICTVRFGKGDLTQLPYESDSFAAVCCLSVFEHMSQQSRQRCIDEFARVLRPGGLLLLTCDVELDGNSPDDNVIGESTFPDLVSMFTKHFDLVFPLRRTPASVDDLLRTDNYRGCESYRLPWNQSSGHLLNRAKYVAKSCLGKIEFRSVAIGAMVLRKVMSHGRNDALR